MQILWKAGTKFPLFLLFDFYSGDLDPTQAPTVRIQTSKIWQIHIMEYYVVVR